MFDNIGGKLKILAWVVFICEAAICIIAGIVSLANANTLSGFILLIGGPLICWITSFPLYGFGVLIENSEIQKNYLAKISKEIQGTTSTPQGLETISNSNEYVVEVAEAVPEKNTIQCPACLKDVPATKYLCPHCGNSLK